MDISQVKINIKLIMKNSVEQSSKVDKVQTRVRKNEVNFASLNVIAVISLTSVKSLADLADFVPLPAIPWISVYLD